MRLGEEPPSIWASAADPESSFCIPFAPAAPSSEPAENRVATFEIMNPAKRTQIAFIRIEDIISLRFSNMIIIYIYAFQKEFTENLSM
jgi:hypothetical protein